MFPPARRQEGRRIIFFILLFVISLKIHRFGSLNFSSVSFLGLENSADLCEHVTAEKEQFFDFDVSLYLLPESFGNQFRLIVKMII